MSTIKSVLVIGGGFSGMSASIELRKKGISVDLIEIDKGWRSYGAGISLGGATIRAFKQLGILEAFLAHGSGHDGVSLHLPHGQAIGQIPTPKLAGPDAPGGGAIMRPILAQILAQATRDAGVHVRLGVSFLSFTQDATGVEVSFTDGTNKRYDLVVGADGLHSKTRETLFPDAPKPRYTGQACWRAVLPRPTEVSNTMMWMGRIKPGINPVSADQIYMFITENRPQNEYVDPKNFATLMKGLLSDFSDPLIQKLRDQIGEDSQIVFRPLDALLLKQSWYAGRVVLIGDAVHATTPHLASGACIGIEDGIVLAHCVTTEATVAEALADFQSRRYERCRMVVENSLRLGEIEMTNGDKAEHQRIMGQSMGALAAPIL